jgi:hypothetical protein
MNRRIKLPALILAVTAATILLGFAKAAPVKAQADSFTVSQTFPIDITVFVPCANGGAGEDVEITGNLHDLFHVTFDGVGGLHVTVHDNPQGISGFGLTTGDTYRGVGITEEHFNGTVGSTDTFVNNFRIIGNGPGNNFSVHENIHVTINANGELTAFVDNFSVTCK